MIDRAAPADASPRNGFVDRMFRLSERSTSPGREIVAGATTFAAMAYILAVNPSIMSTTGMDRGDLVPDPVILGIMKDALSQPSSARGAILDGVVRPRPAGRVAA